MSARIPLTQFQIDTIVRLYHEGKTTRVIAAEVGCGLATANRYISNAVGKRLGYRRDKPVVPGKNSTTMRFAQEYNPLMGRMASISLK